MCNHRSLLKTVVCILLIQTAHIGLAQNKASIKNVEADATLLDNFIKSKGYSSVISFDASNIKQYWIDNSVSSSNGTINILFTRKGQTIESVPFKFQLANVNEAMDCKVDVITEDSDISFSVLDNQSKVLSKSSDEDDFIQNHVISSQFHLEDTSDFAFKLKFASGKSDTLAIKKIVLSFSENKGSSFLFSPGVYQLKDGEYTVTPAASSISPQEKNVFIVKGKSSEIVFNKKILTNDNTLSLSLKANNIGDTPVRIYVGYAPFTKDRRRIGARHSPYKDSKKVLTIISAEKDSNKIIVDTYPDWAKGCFLALNAKEDLSDFPNDSFINSQIISAQKVNENETEIVLEKPLATGIEKGTLVRVQAPFGTKYIYTNNQVLQPGEETILSSTIKKDNDYFQFSPKAFCRGAYYVQPVILVNSIDVSKENTITISDYVLSY